MPDVMDELRIEITAEIKKADGKIDDLCDKIEKLASSLGSLNGKKPTGLQDFQKATEGVSKAATDLASKYKDLGKGFELKGSTQYLQKQVDNLSNALARATLKKNELEMSGSTGGQMYEYAVRDVIKYENQIESLKNQLASIGKTKLSPELELKLSNLEQAENKVKEIVEEIPKVVEIPAESFGYNQQAIEFIENYSERAKTSVQSLAEKLSELTVPEVRTDNIDKLTASIEKTEAKLEELRNKLSNAIVMGTVTESVDDSGYVRLQEQITLTEKQLEAFRAKKAEVESTPSTGLDSFQSKISKIGASLSKVTSGFARFASGIKSVLAKIASLGKSILGLNKRTKGLNTSLSGGLKHLLAYGLGIRSLYALFNKLRNAIKEGMNNLVQFDSETNASMSLLTSSLTQLKNATAAAVSPLLNALAPALNTIIQWCVSATNAVNQLIAALTGKSTWIKAKTLTDDYASSLDKANSSAKKLYSTTLGIDELNINSGETDTSGGSSGTSAGDMFEEVPIDNEFLNMVEKIKDILSDLFAPLLKAWKRQGEFVMNAWKYALEEVWKLIKDIGRDFLTVWNQEETIKMLEDILIIIGDIGLIIGNLAENFREAWSENEIGLYIFENIRDILAVIVHNIRLAADATAEWASNIDFSPLLAKIEGWTASLIPVFDNLSGILTDFYTMVLLPLGKWVLEKGLPDLLQVFIDFNNKVDWEALRTNLAELWKHLEPFAEKVGEGLIDFIEDVSDALADFLNSEEFANFLKDIEDWMDSVSAEDVTNTLKNVAEGLIALKVALVGFSAISSVLEILATVKSFLSIFGAGGASATAIGEATTSVSGLASAFGLLGTVAGGFVIGSKIKDVLLDPLAEWAGLSAEQAEYLKERYEGLGGTLNVVTDFFSLFENAIDGFGFAASNAANKTIALNHVMDKMGEGAIYTDEQLEQLQERFGFTAEDVEMLRQSMLDANEPLANLADDFGLFDASVETLEDVQQGMSLIEDGTVNASNAFDEFRKPMWGMTDDALEFFETLQNGEADLETFKNSVSDAGESISDGLYEGVLNADTDTPAKTIFDKFVEGIKNIFGIHSPAEEMKPLGEYIFLGITEGFSSMFKTFTETMTDFWENYILPWFTLEKWYELGTGILEGLQTKWEEIKQWWSETAIFEWWENDVKPWFTVEKWSTMLNNIKTSFSAKWSETVTQWKTNIKKWWDENVQPWFTKERWLVLGENLKNGIYEGFRGIANKVVDVLNNVISALENMINTALDGINEMISGISDLIGININLSHISFGRIPHFATGGIVTRPTFSLIGEAGPEAVIPLSENSAWISSVADQIESYGSKDSDELLREQNELLRQQNELLSYLADKEIIATLDTSRETINGFRSAERRLGYSFT